MNPLLSLSFLSPGPVTTGAEAALNDMDSSSDNSSTAGEFSRLLNQSGDQQTASRQSLAGFSFINKTKQAASLDPAQAGRPEISLPPVLPETELSTLDDSKAAALLGLLDQASHTTQQLMIQAQLRDSVLAEAKVGGKGEWFILPVEPEPVLLGAKSTEDKETSAGLVGQKAGTAGTAELAAELTKALTQHTALADSDTSDQAAASDADSAANKATPASTAQPESDDNAVLLASKAGTNGAILGEKTAEVASPQRVEAAPAQKMAALQPGSVAELSLATDNADTANMAVEFDNMLLARQTTAMPEPKISGFAQAAEQAKPQTGPANTLGSATNTLFDNEAATIFTKSANASMAASSLANAAMPAGSAEAKKQQADSLISTVIQAKDPSVVSSEQNEPAAKVDFSAMPGAARADVLPSGFSNSFSVPAQVQADGVATRLEAATLTVAQQSAERAKTQSVAKTVTEQLKQVNLLEQNAAGQLKERINLMVRQNIQIAEIRLDPADLGQMQIRVNLQQEHASVQFIVQQQHAKELLEQQMPRLREMLQQQGIQLAEGQVQQQRQDERQAGGQRGGKSGPDNGEQPTEEQATAVQLEVKLSERLVDYYA